MTIGIIDYKAGNARSVQYALTRLGIAAELVTTPDEIVTLERIILPGVGSAGATMEFLEDSGCGEALDARVRNDGVPFLGICVGLQVLFDHSEEDDVKCLGWLPGKVKRFANGLRVPQIGWNEVSARSDWFADLGRHFYFVNSYYSSPDDDAVLAATANYGHDFTAAVRVANITATQFHIEKSGPDGLELLRRWTQGTTPC